MSIAKKFGLGALAVTAALGATACSRVDVREDQSAIKVVNGQIVDESVETGGHWVWWSLNRVEYPRISHRTDRFTITASSGAAACTTDCVTLSTSDQQTVTGSLVLQYHVNRDDPEAEETVMADLYRNRGAVNQEEIEEKLIYPAFADCMIRTVNATTAADLIDRSTQITDEIETCVGARVAPFHITVDNLDNQGFGPSPEARDSMRRFAEARQASGVAEIERDSAAIRRQALELNAGNWGAGYRVLRAQGVPDSSIPTILCLMDNASSGRPCVPGTAVGQPAPNGVR